MQTQATIDRLLGSDLARSLYHRVAEHAPIVDYHCHLDPLALARDHRFGDLCELWVASDPYKHRAMRMAGVPEDEITGSAPPRLKFQRWAETLPRLAGNPLQAWSALELFRFFGVAEPLGPGNAQRIWDLVGEALAGAEYSACGLLRRSGVETLCTSDRLLDDLSGHAALSEAGRNPGFAVLPSLRADDLVSAAPLEDPAWLEGLEAASGMAVDDFASYAGAVGRRLDAFQALGCRLVDHGLDRLTYNSVGEDELAALWERRRSGTALDAEACDRLQSGLLLYWGREYARRGWTLLLHLGAQRRTSSRLRRLAGPAGGYASIGNSVAVEHLCRWFDDLEAAASLPRTILFPLDPSGYAPLATLGGSFTEDGVPGKLQLGPAWWFNDHAAGIRAQLDAQANYGLLSVAVGFTTDSRSFLSMPRHEFFRRVLCTWLGEQTSAGLIPEDPPTLEPLVAGLCGANARAFLFRQT